MREKSAVSPIISTILLIGICTVFASVMFVWVSGLVLQSGYVPVGEMAIMDKDNKTAGETNYIYVDLGDENIVEGIEAGGDYLNTTVDDGVTRNITEVDVSGTGGTWTEYATTSGTPGGFTDPENVTGVPDDAYAWDHLEDQQGVYGSGYATHTGTITSVIIKAEYHATVVGDNDPFRLKYSLDGGSNWGIYQDIAPPLSTTDVEVTLDISSDNSVNGGSWDWTDISNLQIYIYGRFTAGPDGNDVYVDALYCTITSSGDYSLNASYVLDDVGSYDSYTVEFQATALNTTTNSNENFTVEYRVDGGSWQPLGIGYILNGTSEQTLTDTTYAVPLNNVTVRITDNTSGALPSPNTIRIDFIQLRGSTSGSYDLQINYTILIKVLRPGTAPQDIKCYITDSFGIAKAVFDFPKKDERMSFTGIITGNITWMDENGNGAVSSCDYIKLSVDTTVGGYSFCLRHNPTGGSLIAEVGLT